MNICIDEPWIGSAAMDEVDAWLRLIGMGHAWMFVRYVCGKSREDPFSTHVYRQLANIVVHLSSAPLEAHICCQPLCGL